MDKVKIKSIASVLSGNSAPQDKSLFTDGTYPFIRTGDVGKVHRSVNLKNPEDYLNAEGIKGLRLFPKGAILIPKSGASTLLNHRAILGEDSYVASHLAVIIPNNNKVSSKYLYYVLTSIDVGNLVANKAYPSLKTSVIGNVGIPLPHLNEQEHIVAELDLLTGIIDREKALLKELNILASSIFFDIFGSPIENEMGWETTKFKRVFRLKSGDGLTEKEFAGGIYPVYGGNGISGYHNQYNKENHHIVIGRVGAYCGNVRYINTRFWLTDNAFDTLFNINTLDYWFVCYLLNTLDLHQYNNHAAQPVISNVGLKDIDIILPPLSLQQSFAEKIEAIERQKANIKASIAETQKLFDYTMDKYFG